MVCFRAHALREFDRRANLDRFVRGDPSVQYQEIYLLEGGYKRFFEQFQEHVSNVLFFLASFRAL